MNSQTFANGVHEVLDLDRLTSTFGLKRGGGGGGGDIFAQKSNAMFSIVIFKACILNDLLKQSRFIKI